MITENKLITLLPVYIVLAILYYNVSNKLLIAIVTTVNVTIR